MPLYAAYANLYDQVKCDGVVTTLSVVSPIGSGAGALSALQVIVAYDRQGTKNEVTNASDLPSAITVGQLFSYSSAVAKVRLTIVLRR